MSRIPLKSVLRELERRGEVRFGDSDSQNTIKNYSKACEKLSNALKNYRVQFLDSHRKLFSNSREYENLIPQQRRDDVRSGIVKLGSAIVTFERLADWFDGLARKTGN